MLRSTALILALTLLALPLEGQAEERVIHSFAHDVTRAHLHVQGHRILVPDDPSARSFRTPRKRGRDFTLPMAAVRAVHVRYRPTGGKAAVRATFGTKNNVAFPKIDRAAGAGIVTGRRRSALKPGERRIRLSFDGVDVAWVALGSGDPPTTLGETAPKLVGKAGGQPTLNLPAEGLLGFHTMVPKGALLRLDAKTPSGSGEVRVTVQTDQKLLPKVIATATPATGTATLRADLSPYANQVIRLDFSVRGGGPATLLHPRIVLPGTPAKATRQSKQAKHAIIWLVDTLRADRLKAYNKGTRVKAPAMERLAKEGVVFESCVAQGNESLASSASLFTGQYPVVHKLTTPKRRLGKALDLLPEAAKRAGMRTAGFISNGYVSDRWGFDQGFDTYSNFIREGKPSQAIHVVKHFRKFLDKNQNGKRLFAYLGTIDPHVAYSAPGDYRLMYHPKPYKGRIKPRGTGVFLDKWKGNGRKPAISDADLAFLVALYDGEITYNDHHLGELLALLDKAGIADDTLIVLTSDHGEEFLEHGNVGHGHSTRQLLTHVPLILRWPGGLPAGKRVSADVELTDIMPTVLDLVGAKIPKGVQGESLVTLITDDAPVMPRPAFSFHQSIRSVKVGRWKYVLLSKSEKLYDLHRDPHEKKDLAKKQPLTLRYMRELLTVHRRSNEVWRKSLHGHVSSPTAAGAAILEN
jgi:choline-sulfatase